MKIEELTENANKTIIVNKKLYENFLKYQQKILENKPKLKQYMRRYQMSDKGKKKTREIQAAYYIRNKEKIKDKIKKSSIKCDVCNKFIRKYYMKKHIQTLKHKNNLLKNEN